METSVTQATLSAAEDATEHPRDGADTKLSANVIDAEKRHLERAIRETDGNIFGLALSGGGIRSASFAMGVMQALHWSKSDRDGNEVEFDYLKPLHYLSTVSGGGYTGACYTWFRTRTKEFPFGVRGQGSRTQDSGDAQTDVGTKILGFIRQHGDYLFPSGQLGLLSAIGMVGWAIAWSLLVYGLLLFVGILLAYRILPDLLQDIITFLEPAAPPLDQATHSSQFHQILAWLASQAAAGLSYVADGSGWRPDISRFYLRLAAILAIILSLTGVAFVISTVRWEMGYGLRRRFQIFSGWILGWTIALLALAAVPFIYEEIPVLWTALLTSLGAKAATGATGDHAASTIASVIGVGAGLVGAISRFVRELRGSPAKTGIYGNLPIVIATILLMLGMLLATYGLAFYFCGSPPADQSDSDSILSAAVAWARQYPLIFLVLPLLLAYVAGTWVDINRISFHGLYRDRLMEVFTPADRAYEEAVWRPARDANEAWLSKMCGYKRKPASNRRAADAWERGDVSLRTPYHIINANVNLAGSARKEFRGRGGDNFILSPLYCGSDATQFIDTNAFMRGKLTLPTAMAISGAAVNPYSGVDGQGVTRNAMVSMLLTLLNIRLGYWVPRPAPPPATALRRGMHFVYSFILRFGRSSHPNFINPGLVSMFMGGGDEGQSYVELTDGGHFENTGLYELVRRRAKVIIVSDASADPAFTFATLGNAIERVRVDFGAVIRFSDEDLDLSGVLPKSGDNQILKDKFEIAKRGYAIGSITYGGDKDTLGAIIYIKPTMVSDLPGDVFAFRAANPEFPHQPTSDQFFGENQLESYRELGYQLTCDLLETVAALKRDRATEGDKTKRPPNSTTLPQGALDALIALREAAEIPRTS